AAHGALRVVGAGRRGPRRASVRAGRKERNPREACFACFLPCVPVLARARRGKHNKKSENSKAPNQTAPSEQQHTKAPHHRTHHFLSIPLLLLIRLRSLPPSSRILAVDRGQPAPRGPVHPPPHLQPAATRSKPGTGEARASGAGVRREGPRSATGHRHARSRPAQICGCLLRSKPSTRQLQLRLVLLGR
ncbi:hypothetical protein EJB05_07158, partial [Eragrostis curvula]